MSDSWVLTQIRNLRIFQNMAVPDIIREVFKTSRIFEDYYAIRLMAEEGMFFFYEFAEDHHIPVITNSWMNLNKIPGHSDVVIYSKKRSAWDY